MPKRSDDDLSGKFVPSKHLFVLFGVVIGYTIKYVSFSFTVFYFLYFYLQNDNFAKLSHVTTTYK